MSRSINNINRSGARQQYALYNKPPIIGGQVIGRVWSTVQYTASVPVSGQACFGLTKKYYALCGSTEDGVRPGAIVCSTFELEIVKSKPRFADTASNTTTLEGAFAIETRNDFTDRDAMKFNCVVGLGGGEDRVVPLACFIPQPNVAYTIQPLHTYYVTFGPLEKGMLIDSAMLGACLEVDLDKLTGDVTVIHTEDRSLVLQAPG
ncbi:hypothetical protein MBLNU459_g1989t1 [Dothideomycetes sp. NU459]